MELNALTGEIVDAALKVHSAVGPGLLEHAYEVFLRLSGLRHGLLFNFHSTHLRDGIVRMANGW